MDPATLTLLGSAGAALVGLIGRAIAEGDFNKARQLRQQALDEYGEDVLPVLDRVVAQEVGPSAYANIVEDPSVRGAQMDTINELRNVYDTEGQTPADIAASRLAANEVSARAGSDYANNAIRLARMGQSNNPALSSALAAQSGQQAAGAIANAAAQQQIAARQRALQALLQSGNMAGDVRAADFGVASARAGAQDRINMFNADKRTAAANQNNANALDMFGARMGLKSARNSARDRLAATYTDSAGRTLQTAAGVGNALQTAASAGGDYLKKKGD